MYSAIYDNKKIFEALEDYFSGICFKNKNVEVLKNEISNMIFNIKCPIRGLNCDECYKSKTCNFLTDLETVIISALNNRERG